MLDTRHFIETPEGVELSVRAAGPVVRALAWLIDLLIRCAVLLALLLSLALLGNFGTGIALLVAFALEWLYPVVFELRNGATPGKAMFGIKAVHDNGTPIGLRACLLRNLLRAVDFLPLFYGFGLVSVLLTRDFKRLGDLVAGTMVVYRDEVSRRAQLPEASPEAPSFALSVHEQAALVDFAERAPGLAPERAEEIAGLAQPLTGAKGEASIRQLLKFAAWSVGRR